MTNWWNNGYSSPGICILIFALLSSNAFFKENSACLSEWQCFYQSNMYFGISFGLYTLVNLLYTYVFKRYMVRREHRRMAEHRYWLENHALQMQMNQLRDDHPDRMNLETRDNVDQIMHNLNTRNRQCLPVPMPSPPPLPTPPAVTPPTPPPAPPSTFARSPPPLLPPKPLTSIDADQRDRKLINEIRNFELVYDDSDVEYFARRKLENLSYLREAERTMVRSNGMYNLREQCDSTPPTAATSFNSLKEPSAAAAAAATEQTTFFISSGGEEATPPNSSPLYANTNGLDFNKFRVSEDSLSLLSEYDNCANPFAGHTPKFWPGRPKPNTDCVIQIESDSSWREQRTRPANVILDEVCQKLASLRLDDEHFSDVSQTEQFGNGAAAAVVQLSHYPKNEIKYVHENQATGSVAAYFKPIQPISNQNYVALRSKLYEEMYRDISLLLKDSTQQFNEIYNSMCAAKTNYNALTADDESAADAEVQQINGRAALTDEFKSIQLLKEIQDVVHNTNNIDITCDDAEFERLNKHVEYLLMRVRSY